MAINSRWDIYYVAFGICIRIHETDNKEEIILMGGGCYPALFLYCIVCLMKSSAFRKW